MHRARQRRGELRLDTRALGLALAASLAAACALGSPSVPALKSEGRTALAEGRPTEALRALRAATHLAPEDGEAFYLLGVVALRAEHPGEAEEALARAVALEPRNAHWLAAHGLALRAQGRLPQAERELLRSLLLRPADPSTIAALAEVYRLAGETEKCAARYEQFVYYLERQGEPAPDGTQQRALATARERLRECEAGAVSTAPSR